MTRARAFATRDADGKTSAKAMSDTSKITWTDVREVAIRLVDAHPDVDPLTVRFTDLHRWVTELPGFVGDPKKSNESILEAIQMTWIDERDD